MSLLFYAGFGLDFRYARNLSARSAANPRSSPPPARLQRAVPVSYTHSDGDPARP
jgi:hypothetical protein